MTSIRSRMLMLLELETRPFHAEIDAPWQALSGVHTNRGEYVEQLAALYGFVSPLEAALAYTPGMAGYVDIRRRAHAGMIAQDLLALGLGPGLLSSLPQCPLTPFGDPLEALGWLFFRERARKAHLSLEDHLRSSLPFAHDPCGFLTASTATFDHDWTRLGHLVDTSVKNGMQEGIVIDAARAAHERAIAWRSERPVLLQQRTA